MSYKELTIKQLESWGWDVERYKIYGIPWYLRLYFYPIIWTIKREVENTIPRLVKSE